MNIMLGLHVAMATFNEEDKKRPYLLWCPSVKSSGEESVSEPGCSSIGQSSVARTPSEPQSNGILKLL